MTCPGRRPLRFPTSQSLSYLPVLWTLPCISVTPYQLPFETFLTCTMPENAPRSKQTVREVLLYWRNSRHEKKAATGFEPVITILQTVALATWLCRLTKYGAGNGARTRDLNLGKVALYQLSYSRSPLRFIDYIEPVTLLSTSFRCGPSPSRTSRDIPSPISSRSGLRPLSSCGSSQPPCRLRRTLRPSSAHLSEPSVYTP